MNRYLILPVILAIVACGNGDDQTASGTFDDGKGSEGSYAVRGDDENSETVIKTDEGEVRIATGDKAAKKLPFGIQLYPGADIQTSMSGMGEGKSGTMLVFKTTDSADDVITFYRKQMAGKGIAVKTNIKAGDMQMIGGERSNGEGVNVSVTKSPDGAVTATIVASGNR